MLIAPAMLALSAATKVHAQQTDRFHATMSEGMISLQDRVSGRNLITPNLRKVILETTLIPTVILQPVADGFDIRVTYTNHTSTPQDLGTIIVPGIRFGAQVNIRDLRADAPVVVVNHNNQAYHGRGYNYPQVNYSPVFVFDDGLVCMGFSLLYPILEFKHEIQMQLCSPNSPHTIGGRNWELYCRLQGQLPPGQTRTYTLCTRLTDRLDEWVRTLVPYRDFFRTTYGGLQYTRDPRPISGLSIVDPACLSAQSPDGWCGPTSTRPDVVGWNHQARFLKDRPLNGYHRFMLWMPSGIYRNNQHLNFPFQFMTHMNDVPPMRASLDSLRSVPGPNLQAGYWWGNSQAIIEEWDMPSWERLNPNNPAHVARAFEELDMAVDLGATLIGLDAFEPYTYWDGYEWLKKLRQRAPNVKFVIERESGAPDIYHTLGPTWQYAEHITTSKVMADFLLPGHETWAGIRWSVLASIRGHPISESDRVAEVHRIARLGYVPVVTEDWRILGHDFNGQESWLHTIPADLQPGAGGGAGGGGGSGGPGSGGSAGGGTNGGAGGGSTSGSPSATPPPAEPAADPNGKPAAAGGGGGGGGVSGGGGGGGAGLSMGSVSGAGGGPGIATFKNDTPDLIKRTGSSIFSSAEIKEALLRARAAKLSRGSKEKR